mgnify:CR=1 FL=1
MRIDSDLVCQCGMGVLAWTSASGRVSQGRIGVVVALGYCRRERRHLRLDGVDLRKQGAILGLARLLERGDSRWRGGGCQPSSSKSEDAGKTRLSTELTPTCIDIPTPSDVMKCPENLSSSSDALPVRSSSLDGHLRSLSRTRSSASESSSSPPVSRAPRSRSRDPRSRSSSHSLTRLLLRAGIERARPLRRPRSWSASLGGPIMRSHLWSIALVASVSSRRDSERPREGMSSGDGERWVDGEGEGAYVERKRIGLRIVCWKFGETRLCGA